MGTKQIFIILVSGLAITFLNVWAAERDTKLFDAYHQTEGVVWK